MNNNNTNSSNENEVTFTSVEGFEELYNANPSIDMLYKFLKGYTVRFYNDSVSDAAARMIHNVVQHREEIKKMLKAEPIAVLEEMEEMLENINGSIEEEGLLFLGDPIHNNNGNTVGYEEDGLTEENLDQLETDVGVVLELIQEVIREYPKQAANIALSLGQKKNLPSNITRQIINFYGPSNKNYMGRVNMTYERRAKKQAAENAIVQEAARQIQQQVPVSSKKGCKGKSCSVMGGSKKRKTRKSKSKKTKRVKKH
jgi:hypothetical protein